MKWSIVPSGSETDPCCCELPADCCMYPAAMLDAEGGYTADDLPDELAVTITEYDLATTIFSKAISGNIYYAAEIDGRNWTLRLITDELDDVLWEWYRGTEQLFLGQRCLIIGDGNLTPGDDLVEDQFADCYQVDLPDEQGTATVYRQSLCVWSGNASNPCGQQVLLFYCPNSGGFGEDTEGCSPHKWSLSFAHFIVEGCQPNDALIIGKSGNQNSPVGNYPATFYDDTVVSECET
jgi:hypothetical protein